MDKNTKKAILVVSFGTSVNETREKTIDCIEADIREANPDASIYRAWTSKMIIRNLKNRDGVTIHTVKEAMEAMIRDGIKELIVQPTHIINGIENDLMKEDVLAYADHFDSIRFGTPLLTSTKDIEEAIRAFMEDWKDLPEKEALVLMGHGTTHYANTAYAALDYTFKDLGYSNVLDRNCGSLPVHSVHSPGLERTSARKDSPDSLHDRGRRPRHQRYGRRGRRLLEKSV